MTGGLMTMKRPIVKRVAMCSFVLLACLLLGAPQAAASSTGEEPASPDGWMDQVMEWVAVTLGLGGTSGSGDLAGNDELELFGTELGTTSEVTTTEEEGDRAAGVDPNGHTSE